MLVLAYAKVHSGLACPASTYVKLEATLALGVNTDSPGDMFRITQRLNVDDSLGDGGSNTQHNPSTQREVLVRKSEKIYS